MMRAKLKVMTTKKHNDTCEELTFAAVGSKEPYPADGTDENNTFAKWTPCADLRMTITNPVLVGQFAEGQEFYVDFTPAE